MKKQKINLCAKKNWWWKLWKEKRRRKNERNTITGQHVFIVNIHNWIFAFVCTSVCALFSFVFFYFIFLSISVVQFHFFLFHIFLWGKIDKYHHKPNCIFRVFIIEYFVPPPPSRILFFWFCFVLMLLRQF